MTTSRFPEIVLTCRNGHPFTTKARGGATVRCKTCGAPKHVPADRPLTARAAAADRAASEDQDQDEARELAARWEAEQSAGPPPVRAAGGACPRCGAALAWSDRGTRLMCQGCGETLTPPRVIERAEVRRVREAERRERSARLALRNREDPEAALRAALALNAERSRAVGLAQRWAHFTDPDRLPAGSWLLACQPGEDDPAAVALHRDFTYMADQLGRAADRRAVAAGLKVLRELVRVAQDIEGDFRDAHAEARELAEAEAETGWAGDEDQDQDQDQDAEVWDAEIVEDDQPAQPGPQRPGTELAVRSAPAVLIPAGGIPPAPAARIGALRLPGDPFRASRPAGTVAVRCSYPRNHRTRARVLGFSTPPAVAAIAGAWSPAQLDGAAPGARSIPVCGRPACRETAITEVGAEGFPHYAEVRL